ncbi:hypothetical protein [Leucobacter sp.]
MPRSIPLRASTTALALLATATLALTGCSGDGKTGAEATAEDGPLGKYLSALWDGEEYTQEKLDAETKQTEELVAECMSEEGFEYVPDVQNGGTVYSSESDEIDWNSEEFVEQYGYGIVNWPGMDDMPEDTGEEYVDPNQDYVESLSESEQQAYYEALNGPGPTDEEIAAMEDEDGGYEWDWTTSGCYGSAQHQVQTESNGGMAAYEDPEFAELFEATNELYEATWSDESQNDDVIALNREWAECMADAGYDGFSSPMLAQQTLSDEYYELQMPDGEEGEWQEPSAADKKKFQEREIEVALTDRDCKKKLAYEDELLEIQFDLEQKFVDEHRAELDALVAKHGVEKKQ